MASFLEQSEKSHRFMEKLKKEHFLNEFDPIQDYSLLTIFSRLPEESGIEKSEGISIVRSNVDMYICHLHLDVFSTRL